MDAAVFGCWRRETLQQLGMFDEDLASSSNMDPECQAQENRWENSVGA